MPDKKVLVSAFTVGGYNMAKQIIPEADAIIFYPLDLPFVAESVVRRIHPGVFMPVETELWPNFLRAIKERRIPVMMVNGRISEKSMKNYRYLYKIWDDMLATVTVSACSLVLMLIILPVWVQTQEDICYRQYQIRPDLCCCNS
jgi:3-deoxy-D-manno-octulosonic-acid transferase